MGQGEPETMFRTVEVMSLVPGDKILCSVEGKIIVRQVATITMTTHLNEDGHYLRTSRDLGFQDGQDVLSYGVNDEVVKANGQTPLYPGGFRYGG